MTKLAQYEPGSDVGERGRSGLHKTHDIATNLVLSLYAFGKSVRDHFYLDRSYHRAPLNADCSDTHCIRRESKLATGELLGDTPLESWRKRAQRRDVPSVRINIYRRHSSFPEKWAHRAMNPKAQCLMHSRLKDFAQ